MLLKGVALFALIHLSVALFLPDAGYLEEPRGANGVGKVEGIPTAYECQQACQNEPNCLVNPKIPFCDHIPKLMHFELFDGEIIFHNGSSVSPCFFILVCPEEKSSFCSTYVSIMSSICDNDWFTNENGRYSCQKSCGMCQPPQEAARSGWHW